MQIVTHSHKCAHHPKTNVRNSPVASMELSYYVPTAFSSLFRLAAFVFLRVVSLSWHLLVDIQLRHCQVPVRWAKIVLPALYLASLASSWFATSPTPAMQNRFTKSEPVSPEEKDIKPVKPGPAHEVRLFFRLN